MRLNVHHDAFKPAAMNVVFSVTYYLEARSFALFIYYVSRIFLSTNVESVVLAV